jgi:hypothetical protein
MIFARKNLSKYSSSIYFLGLAVADSFALNIECLHFFVPNLVNYINSQLKTSHWAALTSSNPMPKLRHYYTLAPLNDNLAMLNSSSTFVETARLATAICKLRSLTFYTAYEISSW